MSALAARRSDHKTKAALRRVIQGRLHAGLAEIDARGEAASLHELRKRTKELRGLLRMLYPGFPDFARVNDQLRDAALALSPARDAEVMLANFDGVTAELRDPSSFTGLRARLQSEVEARRATVNADALPQYAQVFSELDHELSALNLSDKASRVMWAGLRKTWSLARKRHRQAQAAFKADLDAAPFHAWRKSVKHHWYQARFLRKIAPRKMARHIAQIDDLGEILGQHNDLDILIGFLQAQKDLPETERHARALFIRHGLGQRRVLARKALDLARRVLAPPPDKLIGQWQDWWTRWRKA